MAVINGAHLGEELEGQHSRLAEVGHHTHRHREQTGVVLHQPQSALLGLHAELQAEQTLVLVRQRLLEDGLGIIMLGNESMTRSIPIT